MKTKLRWQVAYILVTLVLLSVAMALVDGVIKPPYAVKSAIKAVLFLAAPLILFAASRADRAACRHLFTLRWRPLLFSLGAGVLLYVAIVGGYLLLRDYLDFSAITGSLTADSGITADNFLYVSAYISLCNSFLEEFFFRGYGFLTLRRYTGRWVACLFSAFLFSFYHVGMTLGWVAPWLFVIELVGLMAAGLFFNLINERTQTIYPSWLIHMFCNFGINTIGCILFGIF